MYGRDVARHASSASRMRGSAAAGLRQNIHPARVSISPIVHYTLKHTRPRTPGQKLSHAMLRIHNHSHGTARVSQGNQFSLLKYPMSRMRRTIHPPGMNLRSRFNQEFSNITQKTTKENVSAPDAA